MIRIPTLAIFCICALNVQAGDTKPLILPDFSAVRPPDSDAPVRGVVNCVDKDGLPVQQGDQNVKECKTTVFKNDKKIKVNATVDAAGKPGAGISVNSGKSN